MWKRYLAELKAWWNKPNTAGERHFALLLAMLMCELSLFSGAILALAFFQGAPRSLAVIGIMASISGIFFGLLAARIEKKFWNQLRAEGWHGED